jgi:hypothetical protein
MNCREISAISPNRLHDAGLLKRCSNVEHAEFTMKEQKMQSILAEAIRNQENIHATRERLSVLPHVETHYRALGLPALVAAAASVKHQPRANGQRAAKAPRNSAEIFQMLDR